MCWVTNIGNMAQIYQIMKLHHMDRIYIQIHKQLFSRSRGNTWRKYSTNKTRSKIKNIEKKVLQLAEYGTTVHIPLKNNYDIYGEVTDTKHTIYTNQTGKVQVT